VLPDWDALVDRVSGSSLAGGRVDVSGIDVSSEDDVDHRLAGVAAALFDDESMSAPSSASQVPVGERPVPPVAERAEVLPMARPQLRIVRLDPEPEVEAPPWDDDDGQGDVDEVEVEGGPAVPRWEHDDPTHRCSEDCPYWEERP
jgi:hypothetical protein